MAAEYVLTQFRADRRLSAPAPRPWHLADIDFDALDTAKVAHDRMLFQIVALASFIETGSDVYANNLITYFDDDAEVAHWLDASWKPEELQHGRALRAYVERAWPSFDWDTSFAAFFADYSRTCTVPELEPARALELAARCVVEMGTSTLYRALTRYATEPVLKDLAARIYVDEVRHYKHFYRYFRKYQRRERHGRWRIARTMLKRLGETRTGDGYCAYRHIWRAARDNTQAPLAESYATFRAEMARLARRCAAPEQPIEMLLRPLELPPAAVRGAKRFGGALYRWWLGS